MKLVGPELLRVPLQSLSAEDAVGWVRGFAREFLKPGKKLTTPIEVVDVPGGALLRFLKSGSGYDDDDEDLDDDPWASKGACVSVVGTRMNMTKLDECPVVASTPRRAVVR